MKKLFLHIISIVLPVAGLTAADAARSEVLIMANSIYAHAMAMGGALTAIPANLANALYNPAAMGLDVDYDKKVNLYFNPLSAASALINDSELSSRESKTAYDWLTIIGFFARAVTFSTPAFQFSAILSEELLNNPQKIDEKKFISTRGVLDWNYHSIAARLTLAKQVSLGATGYAFNLLDDTGKMQHSLGSSYGILMRPSDKISAGVSYYNFPEKADSLMFAQHRISTKSVNMGIVYHPFTRMHLAIDFRNVSEEDNNSTNEVHAGIEIIPARFLAIRCGYFQKMQENINTFSLGFGLADFRMFRSAPDRFVFSNIILNYALQVEAEKHDISDIHYLTFLIRL